MTHDTTPEAGNWWDKFKRISLPVEDAGLEDDLSGVSGLPAAATEDDDTSVDDYDAVEQARGQKFG